MKQQKIPRSFNVSISNAHCGLAHGSARPMNEAKKLQSSALQHSLSTLYLCNVFKSYVLSVNVVPLEVAALSLAEYPGGRIECLCSHFTLTTVIEAPYCTLSSMFLIFDGTWVSISDVSSSDRRIFNTFHLP